MPHYETLKRWISEHRMAFAALQDEPLRSPLTIANHFVCADHSTHQFQQDPHRIRASSCRLTGDRLKERTASQDFPGGGNPIGGTP